MYEGHDDFDDAIINWRQSRRLSSSKAEDVESYLLSLIKRFPNGERFNNYLGLYYVRRLDLNKALRYFRKAEGRSPSYALLNNIGITQFYLGNTQDAITYLSKLLRNRRKPIKSHVYYVLGLAYLDIKNYDESLKYLRHAVESKNGERYKTVYLEVYSRYRDNRAISDEFIQGLMNNLSKWDISIIDELPILSDNFQKIHRVLSLYLLGRHRKLSARSKTIHILALSYLHYMSSASSLLNTNSTLSCMAVGRTMFEAYVRTMYGMLSHTNRKFAEQELSELRKKRNANNRLLGNTMISPQIKSNKVIENKKINARILHLEKKYVDLDDAPSLAQISLILDQSESMQSTYQLYEYLYGTGSDAIHLSPSSMNRLHRLSGDESLNISTETRDLFIALSTLSLSFSKLILELPEFSIRSKQNLKRELRNLDTFCVPK